MMTTTGAVLASIEDLFVGDEDRKGMVSVAIHSARAVDIISLL